MSVSKILKTAPVTLPSPGLLGGQWNGSNPKLRQLTSLTRVVSVLSFFWHWGLKGLTLAKKALLLLEPLHTVLCF